MLALFGKNRQLPLSCHWQPDERQSSSDHRYCVESAVDEKTHILPDEKRRVVKLRMCGDPSFVAARFGDHGGY